MKQRAKLIKIGNSVGFTLPPIIREEAGLRLGDAVMVDYDIASKVIAIQKKQKPKGGVDAKFIKLVDEFIDEHEDVLEELANR